MLTNQHLRGKIDLLIFQQVYFCKVKSIMVRRFEAFTLGLSRLNAGWSKLAAQELKPYGLKGTDAVYLVALHKHKDGLSSVNLCEICNKDKAEVSRAVAMLEEKGIVMREHVSKNGYRAKIMLTQKGNDVTCAIRERIQLAVEQGGSGLTDEQREHFYYALQVIADNLYEINKTGLSE